MNNNLDIYYIFKLGGGTFFFFFQKVTVKGCCWIEKKPRRSPRKLNQSGTRTTVSKSKSRPTLNQAQAVISLPEPPAPTTPTYRKGSKSRPFSSPSSSSSLFVHLPGDPLFPRPLSSPRATTVSTKPEQKTLEGQLSL